MFGYDIDKRSVQQTASVDALISANDLNTLLPILIPMILHLPQIISARFRDANKAQDRVALGIFEVEKSLKCVK